MPTLKKVFDIFVNFLKREVIILSLLNENMVVLYFQMIIGPARVAQ